MESGALILPDNTVLDTSQPPPGFSKPDFSEVVSDEPNDVPLPEKNDGPLSKPTFKNALQAKKRLQAFSSARVASLPTSPSAKKLKINLSSEEKNDESKKSTKKAIPEDKAKTVIEEIEEIKREEQAYWDAKRQSTKRSRSRTRSKSPHKGRFKKVEKKARNYRKRSVSPEKSKKVHKKLKKYPKNWKEFNDFDLNFNLNHDFEVQAPIGNNELLKQIRFESPSLPTITFKMKTVNREDKVIPFEFLRYTRTKPIICHSVNYAAIKESFLSRKLIFDALPKEIIANIENLFSNSLKFKLDSNNKKNTKNWFPKVWKDSDDQCRLLEKSIGLSFLQTYTGEEDENELVAEGNQPEPEIEEKCSQIIKDETKQKKNKAKIEILIEKKKKNKEKKKVIGDNADEVKDKRKKRKKDKTKKKEKKKARHKKVSKEKKKKDKKHQIGENITQKDKLQKLNKELIVEDLEIIEEKLTKRKEQEKHKEDVKVDKPEREAKEGVRNRKRKHSEHEEKSKKGKYEKHKKGNQKSEDINKLSKKDKKPEEISRNRSTIEKPHSAVEKHIENKKLKSTIEIVEDLADKDECKSIEKKKKKSRWSDVDPNSQIDIKVVASDLVINNEEIIDNEHVQAKETTPDTDEYHSHWESDDDVSSSIPRQSIKINRTWESDEELFDRTRNVNKTSSPSYSNLEIPLIIGKFSKRPEFNEKPLSYVNEIKLLEEERRSLSEERKKLELERQKILKLQEEAKLEIEEKKTMPKQEIAHGMCISSTPEMEQIGVKKENTDVIDFNIDSLNNSLLSNVSSVESNFPIAALENEYEEFIKAVSSDSSVQPKKKLTRTSSSSSSSSESDHKKKKRKKRKKKKRKMREVKSGNIFDEFDIPVPSDLPEIVPTPVPVPSPIENIVPMNTTSIVLQSIIDVKNEEQELDIELKLTKPFIFPSIVLPSKRTSLVDNSNLKLNDDSDSVDFTDKFVKKSDEKHEIIINNEELIIEAKIEDIVKAHDLENKNIADTKENTLIKEESKNNEDKATEVTAEPNETQKIGDKKISNVKGRCSTSASPQHRCTDKPKENKRSRSRSRSRRRSPIRRKELTSPLHRRYSSPRRRSPPRRRGSPRRFSPSPRRRISSPRWRKRSSSISPPRSRISARKRTPSPRIRRASPLNSPLDGFKRSVADSTISDDMLPQPTPDEYSESPPSYRKGCRRDSVSPQQSPRRISLDDRINQVLGLEMAEQAKQQPPPTTYPPNYQYPQSYGHQFGQYQQYNQFSEPKNDYIPPFVPPPVFTQPPPPIIKPVPSPAPSKVVQVGNILQVVPNEEITEIRPVVIENKAPETSQKIVQVGNMLQIVPAVIPPTKPLMVEIAPTQPPQPIETQSAESIMKQKNAERKAERDKRRQERERRRKEKEKKRKERERRKQMKLKIKAENMIKRAIQIEAEALASEDLEDEIENQDLPVQWPPVPVVVTSSSPSCKGILLIEGSSRKRKSVQFADGVKPGEGTSPSGGEELSSPPPAATKLPKEKRYKKVKIPKKNKKKKIKVKVVKKVVVEDDGDDEDDSLPPPSPPPGSPPPHLFPSRVKTHTINNVHQYIGNIIQAGAPAFPFRPPMPVIINRHQPPPGYMSGSYHGDVGVPLQPYQGAPSHH